MELGPEDASLHKDVCLCMLMITNHLYSRDRGKGGRVGGKYL